MKLLEVTIILAIIGVVCATPLILEKEKSKSEEWREAWSKLATLEEKLRRDSSGCQCIEYDCGCCVDLDIPKIHLDSNACVNVSYLPTQYGISITLSIGGKVYINETVSARNPPPICIGIPHFEKDASVCLDFYDLDYSASTFSGCIKLEARLYHMKVESVELGCFKFPLAVRKSHPMVLLQKAKRMNTFENELVNRKLTGF